VAPGTVPKIVFVSKTFLAHIISHSEGILWGSMTDFATQKRAETGQISFLAEVFSPSGNIQLERFTELLRVTKTDR